jgi:LPXTG-motif cell wall-anchored protein
MSLKKTALSAIAALGILTAGLALPSAAEAATALNFNCSQTYQGGTYYVIPGQTLNITATGTGCIVKVGGTGSTNSASVTYAEVDSAQQGSGALTVEVFDAAQNSVVSFDLNVALTNRTNVTGQHLNLTKTATITQSPKWFTSDQAIDSNGIANKPECKLAPGQHPYSTLKIKISKSGDFTFRVVSTSPGTSHNARVINSTTANPGNAFNNPIKDNFMAVYSSFNPADLSAGIVGCNDDSYDSTHYRNGDYLESGQIINDRWPAFASTLQPGEYTLVLSTFSDYQPSAWTTNSFGLNQGASFQLWGPEGAISDGGAPAALPNTGSDHSGISLLGAGAGIAVIAGIAIMMIRRRRTN